MSMYRASQYLPKFCEIFSNKKLQLLIYILFFLFNKEIRCHIVNIIQKQSNLICVARQPKILLIYTYITGYQHTLLFKLLKVKISVGFNWPTQTFLHFFMTDKLKWVEKTPCIVTQRGFPKNVDQNLVRLTKLFCMYLTSHENGRNY